MADQKIAPPVRLVDTSNAGQTNIAVIDSSGNLSVKLNSIGSVTLPVSGTVTSNAGTGNFNVIGTGTAGSPAAGVLTVQGIASMTALKVDGSGVTQPVSGTVTANAGTGTFAISAASLPLPSGAATETSLAKLTLAQGSTTSGQTGLLNLAAVTTAAPTYTTGQSSPLSLTTAGALRVDGSGSTQPVSIAATVVIKADTAGNQTNALKVDGSAVTQPVSGTVTANAGTGTFAVSGTVTANLGTIAGVATETTLAKLTVAQNAALGTNTLIFNGASVTTAAPTYTTGNISALSLTTSGALRVDIGATSANGTAIKVDGSAVTQPVSGTVTANAGTGTFAVSGTVTANAGTGTMNIAGTGTAGTPAGGVLTVQGATSMTALKVDGSGVTQPVSGTITANLGTLNGAATAAKQPALGTAGSPSADVITVQGATSMTALKVDGSATTQPISGNIGLSDALLDGAAAGSAKALIVAGKDGSGNAQMLLTDTSGNLNVNVVSGGSTGDTPTSPTATYTTTTDLAAGASTTTAHQTSDLTTTGTLYCAGFDVAASVPVKASLQAVVNNVATTLATIFVNAGDFGQWKPPHRQFAPVTLANSAGFDGFRVIVTNLDGSEAANTYCTIYHQSN